LRAALAEQEAVVAQKLEKHKEIAKDAVRKIKVQANEQKLSLEHEIATLKSDLEAMAKVNGPEVVESLLQELSLMKAKASEASQIVSAQAERILLMESETASVKTANCMLSEELTSQEKMLMESRARCEHLQKEQDTSRLNLHKDLGATRATVDSIKEELAVAKAFGAEKATELSRLTLEHSKEREKLAQELEQVRDSSRVYMKKMVDKVKQQEARNKELEEIAQSSSAEKSTTIEQLQQELDEAKLSATKLRAELAAQLESVGATLQRERDEAKSGSEQLRLQAAALQTAKEAVEAEFERYKLRASSLLKQQKQDTQRSVGQDEDIQVLRELLAQKDGLIGSLQAKQAGAHAAIEQAKSTQDALVVLRTQNAELTQQFTDAAERMRVESEQMLAERSKASLELKLATAELVQTIEQLTKSRESERFLRAANEEQDVRIAVLMGKLEQTERRMEELREEHRSSSHVATNSQLSRPAKHTPASDPEHLPGQLLSSSPTAPAAPVGALAPGGHSSTTTSFVAADSTRANGPSSQPTDILQTLIESQGQRMLGPNLQNSGASVGELNLRAELDKYAMPERFASAECWLVLLPQLGMQPGCASRYMWPRTRS
jgi:hypothetical protein